MSLPLDWLMDWVTGQLIQAVNMLSLGTVMRELTGMVAYGVTGQTAWLPIDNPVGVTAPGGMQVDIGGADEIIFLPDPDSNSVAKPAYSLGVVTQTINTADPTHPRIDLICVQYENTDVNAQTVPVIVGSPPPVNTTVYQLTETFQTMYVEGTAAASPVPPATPSGWVALAQILVPATTTNIVSGDITIVLPSFIQIIQNLIFNPGGSGNFLTEGPGIDLVKTVNGAGDVTSIEIENIGVLSVTAASEVLTGAVAVASPDGSVDINVSGDTIEFSIGSLPFQPGLCYSVANYSTATSGTLAFGSALPGTGSDDYTIVVMGTTSFASEGQTCTLTGSGATWPTSPRGIGNGDGATTPIFMSGTATGGQTPEVAWSQSAFGAQGIDLIILAFPT
jgi:hypothetical protein